MMRAFPAAAVILAMAALVAAPTPGRSQAPEAREGPSDQGDLNRLQGTWAMTAMETDGDEVPAERFQDYNAVYRDNTVTLRVGEKVRRRGVITLDASRRPRAINTWDRDGPYDDQTVPGIYELDGDTLKLCFARPGEPRPSEFTTKKGTGFLFAVYKRVKP